MNIDIANLWAMLDKEHIHELEQSAIASDIANLNFSSWNPGDESDLDRIFLDLVDEPAHANNGTLSGKSNQELVKTLRSGGWIFSGHTGRSVKPNIPRKNTDGEIIKYESPRGAGNQQLFIPHVSIRVGALVAKCFGIDRDLPAGQGEDIDLGFWAWFLTTDIPLIITEGAKCAAAPISHGYPAVALNGIWGWGANEKNMDGEIERDELSRSKKILNSDLVPFLEDREIIFAFDRDTKPATVKMVEGAKKRFREEIDSHVDKVTQLRWREGKGIDDFIAARGVKSLDRAYSKRSDFPLALPKQAAPESKFVSTPDGGLVRLGVGRDEEGQIVNVRERIGNHLAAIAFLNNPDGDGAALYLEFKTCHGEIKNWTMPRADLAGEGGAIISGLMSREYDFRRKQKNLLLDYLHEIGSQVTNTCTITDSSGWVGESFVMPHQTYGDVNLKFRNMTPPPDVISELRGDLAGWIETVATRCAGNSRLIFALGTSFAAPLLPIVGLESGGFHIVGDTSLGKTTLLRVAASVTGIKDIPHWRVTTNGLESIATAFNNLCLPLDEMKQADAKDVGDIAYMLGNGQGKARMTKNLTNRKPKTWQLMVLSSGEVTLANYMKQAGIIQKGGQEVRMPDIPAAPQSSLHGCFETIHEADEPGQFASSLEASTKSHHGTALDSFLSQLVIDVQNPNFGGMLSQKMNLIAAVLLEGTKDTAVGRVAKRFALVQAALGLAHQYGLLPFPVEEIEWAIGKIFKEWMMARGGDGSSEIKQAIDRIEHLLVTNEHSDRIFTLPNNNDRVVRNLLGYRKLNFEGSTEEFWIPPSVFDKEFCDGVNKTELVKELDRLGWLYLSEEGRTRPRVVTGKRSRFYILKFPNGVLGVDPVDPVDPDISKADIPTVSRTLNKDPQGWIPMDPVDPQKTSSQIRDPQDPEGSTPMDPKIHLPNTAPVKDSAKGSTGSIGSTPKTPIPDTRIEKAKNQTKPFPNPKGTITYQRYILGKVGNVQINFSTKKLAKEWSDWVALVFGFYSNITKIEPPVDNFKWKVTFLDFDREALTRMERKDLSLPPQQRP